MMGGTKKGSFGSIAFVRQQYLGGILAFDIPIQWLAGIVWASGSMYSD